MYNELPVTLLLSSEEHAMLTRYMEEHNERHRLNCERRGIPYSPLKVDALVGAIVCWHLRDEERARTRKEQPV